MTPYYDQDGITIYHGDCLDVLPTLSGTLVFTDPPYNSGLHYGDETNDRRPDYWEWLGARIVAMKEAAPAVLIKHSAIKIAEFETRWPSRVLVWYKPFSSGFPLNGVATHWEPIHWLQGKATTWSKDVFEWSSGNTNRESTTGHPAQMPEALPKHWIATFSNPGDIVIDPFMGSGTTLRAAKDLGRRAIGIEINKDYCDIAIERLRQGVLL